MILNQLAYIPFRYAIFHPKMEVLILCKRMMVIFAITSALLCGCNSGDSDASSTTNPNKDSSSQKVTDGSADADALVISQQDVLKAGIVKNGNYVLQGDLKVSKSNSVTIANDATLTIK